MVNKKCFILILFFNFFFIFCYSQKKQTDDLGFMLNKIKKVYVGYKDKVNEKEFEKIVAEIKKSNLKDTFNLLSKLTLYFNDRHLVLYQNDIQKKTDYLQCKKDSLYITQYLNDSTQKKDSYEGYWLGELNDYIIGIKKTSSKPLIYKGYVIESRGKFIGGFCNIIMKKTAPKQFLTDYRGESRLYTKALFKSPKIMIIGAYGKWKKLDSYQAGMLANTNELSFDPSFKIIDKNTVLLTMPDFGGIYVKRIDSIIKSNDSILSNTQTLILDIRNNMGGTIRNYFPIFPYIYTQPIVHCDSYRLCSDYVIDDLRKNIKNAYAKGDTGRAMKYEKSLNEMLPYKGKLLFYAGDTLSNNLSIKKFPKNVAIITNNACLSSAELMILNFKQSSKVKLFGEATGGAVDYLDLKVIDLPSMQYTLYVPTTKRALTLTAGKYDNVGIKPDIEISDDVSDWIEFVKKYYEKN